MVSFSPKTCHFQSLISFFNKIGKNDIIFFVKNDFKLYICCG